MPLRVFCIPLLCLSCGRVLLFYERHTSPALTCHFHLHLLTQIEKKRAKKNQLNPHPASADRRPLRIERRALLSSALCVTNPSLMCFFPLPESLLVLMDMLSVFSLGLSNPCNALYVPVRSPPESAKWRRVDGGWGNVGVYIFR